MNKEDLLPEGSYDGVAVLKDDDQGKTAYARITETKKLAPMVVAHFQILNPPEGVTLKYPLRWNGNFAKTVIGKPPNERTVTQNTTSSLRAMGWKSNDISDIETEELDQIVSVTVKHEQTQDGDGWYAAIGWVNAAGGGTVKISPMDDAKKRKFAAQMMQHASKSPLVAGKRYTANGASNDASGAQVAGTGSQQPPPREEPPPPEHDDIPF